MSDIYASVIVPTAPTFSEDIETFEIPALNKYIRKLTVFQEDLLYKMKKASIFTSQDGVAWENNITGNLTGNVNGTIGVTTPSTGAFTTITGTLSTASQSNITSLGTIVSLVATTADINNGTIEAVIGGTTPKAGSFTGITMTGDINFDQNEAIELVLENRTTDPASPVAGQMWYRTDL